MDNENQETTNHEEREPTEFVGIRIEVPSNQPMMLFKRQDSDMYLPIAIGMAEATSIMFVLQNVLLPRPLTHDLFVSVMEELHIQVKHIHISNVVNNTYYADITYTSPTGEFVLSARPSDAVALSVRMKEPVTYSVNPELFNRSSIQLDSDTTEEEINQFIDFLNDVNPDDFNM